MTRAGQGRWDRLRDQLRARKITALLVNDPVNISYLTGYRGTFGVLVVTTASGFLLTDGRYWPGIKTRRGAAWRPILITQKWQLELKKLLDEEKSRDLWFEAEGLTYGAVSRLRKILKGIRFHPTSGIVESLRVIKDGSELSRIRKALRITREAFLEVIAIVRPGTTEQEIAVNLSHALRTRGGEKESFEIIVASGPRSAIPHGYASNRILKDGDWVVIDFGAVVDGYHADLTRTLHLGRFSPGDREIFAAVLDAQRKAEAAIGPGVPAREVYLAARKALDKKGLGRYFVHGLGHGIGLSIHEAPQLSRESKDILEEGMVVTIEPGVYLPGKGGIRVEDVVAVTAGGCRNLTKKLKKRWEIK